ncbi:MAG TPA: threonine--tRNA ligase [Bdellovibrionales bacterium]|nr:threonine--tRNA ligase [Bdellovibrionales bacterium]
MSAVRITLPDGKVLEFEREPSVLEVAQRIGAGLAKGTLGAKINGSKEIIDLRTPLKDGTKLEIVSTKSPDAVEVMRHSAAHVMAQAVQEIWPDVKVTIGPVIENGFFYDFDSPRPFAPEDLEKIEKKMEEIIKRDLPIVREEWDADKAIDTFVKMGENYKEEIISDLKAKGEKTVGVYHQGQWFDLCRGPHVQSTGQIKSVKVMSLAGAYWRGDEKRPQLQRIYATAFADKKDLQEYLTRLEEAKKRDHRKLGKELGLFMFHPFAPGSPFFTGKGSIVYNELVNYIRSLYFKTGYEEVITPQVFNVDLYKTSGHYGNYKDNMYFTSVSDKEEGESGLKPMNCPSHCLMFGNERRSYRELPTRMADFGRLHRFERSGVVHGVTRVRTFCQDDAHIFCTPDQMGPEIKDFMSMAKVVYEKLGMPNFKVLIATRPENRMGSDEIWDKAENGLIDAMKSLGIPYEISPGEGAFYGPKVEIHFVDAIGRSWQLGTIQVDYNMPEAFKLEYVGEDNASHRPVMLHRAILGSLERFIGIYIEHCAGHFPTWLAPRQVVVMNVTDRQTEYCNQLTERLRSQGVRAEYDNRNEKLGFKIREAQMAKVPYMLIIGDQEVADKTVSVRLKNGANLNGLAQDEFVGTLVKEINERSLNSLFEAPQGAKEQNSNMNQEVRN